jgi:hypothetical protein
MPPERDSTEGREEASRGVWCVECEHLNFSRLSNVSQAVTECVVPWCLIFLCAASPNAILSSR